jgi:chromosome segregation ATPase
LRILWKLLKKRNLEEKICKLECIIDEKEATLHDLVQRVNEVEAKLETIEKGFCEKTSVLEESNNTNYQNDEKIKAMERQIYILEKRRLGSDFCEFCEKEFKSGCEKDRQEKDSHIRDNNTFECKVCVLRHDNKEELEIHLITCKQYACSLCSYRHKRLSEMKSHCKNKTTCKQLAQA